MSGGLRGGTMNPRFPDANADLNDWPARMQRLAIARRFEDMAANRCSLSSWLCRRIGPIVWSLHDPRRTLLGLVETFLKHGRSLHPNGYSTTCSGSGCGAADINSNYAFYFKWINRLD
jgi:hypothetical protein